MLNLLTAGALALSSLAAAPAPVELAPAPPDGSVKVQVATAAGSGCPAGSYAVAADPANSFFTVTYDNFIAQAGAGTRPTDARRNCQISVVVKVPQGFTYAIAKTDYRGYANLARGAYATEKANYYFQGMSQTASISHRFNGAWNDSWQATDKVGIAAMVFRPCGEQRNFNINTEIVVNAGSSSRSATSFMTMDSTDGDFETIYHFAWKTCP
jgi:hypothetical protein